MKHGRIFTIIAAAVLALALPAAAVADETQHYQGGTNWEVTFTSGGSMVDNYSQQEWADNVGTLQPGDDITFKVTLNHENATACDWYMANEVIKSLEESVASGSAYSYYLTYTSPEGGTPRVLYDSSRVGGDNPAEGLGDATSGLQDFFYLDNLSNGESAHVDLTVGLDGETEGNAYFDTLAQLKMKFAVEMDTNTTPPSSSTRSSSSSSTTSSTPAAASSNRTAVQTGDDTDLFPFFVTMAVSGALLMALGVYGVMARRREREDR